jgi:D-psicose/D-tagatose/L-ribulose 3-epimerase
MSTAFRHSICNEIFQGWDFRESCRFMRAAGYQGIEIAPFTLAEDPATISAGRRAELRQIIVDEGLSFVGLHWLMVSPKGLHVTTPDDELRQRGWQHIVNLIDLCADLGPRGVLVFGSPKQRCTVDGSTVAEATRRYIDGLASVAGHAAARGVRILVEALPRDQTDVVGSLAEAVGIVKEINSPGVRTMFDSHNAVDETEPHHELVTRFLPFIEHVHVNETDGKHCGRGNYPFRPVLRALRDGGYPGWISLEAFDFSFGAETIARESIDYLNGEIAQL